MASSTSLKRGEVSSSAGLAGRGPHGRIDRLGTADCWTALSSVAWPAMTEAMPTVPGTLKILWTRGLRKSQSISTVRLPDWAIDTAMLAASVDLPSEAFGLVTWMTWCPAPRVLKYSAVRTPRYASASTELDE